MLRLWLVATLSIASVARADSALLSASPDPVNYLIYYERVRNNHALYIAAQGFAAAAVAQAAYDETNYQRTKRLHDQGVAPEEELRDADLKRQVSKSSIDRYRHEALGAKALMDANDAVLPLLEGQTALLSGIYEHFKRAWDEQCTARKFRHDEAAARKAFADYRLALGEGLQASGAITYEDLQLRQSEQGLAIADEQASKGLLDTCRDGEPSLDYLEGIARLGR